VLGALRRVELADDVLHLLRLVLRGDEHRIARLDHDRVGEAEHRDHPALGPNVAALHALNVHVAAQHVPAFVPPEPRLRR
jgi:hypothetical protein